MCQSGVNNAQLITMVKMADDSVRLNQAWVKELAHLAGHANLESTPKLTEAAKKLREVDAVLAEAIDELEVADQTEDFAVELV
jgi:hypothetical protein